MKRKQAMACNAPGPTCNYLSMAQANAMQNGGYPAQAIESFEVFKGIDYSFVRNRGSIRSKILPRIRWNPDVECFRLGVYDLSRAAYYFYGFRVVIEFFDENAILDWTGPLDEGASLEFAVKKWVRLFPELKCEMLNDFLMDVRL